MAKKIDKWPPVLPANRAFLIVDRIYKSYGKEVNFDLLPDILDCSRKSSNFSKRIIALQGFGLASANREVLSLTQLGLRIAAPVSPQERKESTLESVNLIPILRDLVSRYPGGHLPDKSHLGNLLTREYGLPDESLANWIEFVTDSLGVLRIERLRQIVESDSPVSAKTDMILETSKTETSSREARIVGKESDTEMLKVPLGGERYILVPKNLSDKEAEYFTKWFGMWKELQQ